MQRAADSSSPQVGNAPTPTAFRWRDRPRRYPTGNQNDIFSDTKLSPATRAVSHRFENRT